MVRAGVRPVSFCLVRLVPGSTVEIGKKKKEKRKTERAGLLTKGGGCCRGGGKSQVVGRLGRGLGV